MPILNAQLALSPPTISFEVWLRELDRICKERLSLSLGDLPDLPTRNAYHAGVGPAVFFELVVSSRLSESDVSFMDAIVCGDEDLLDNPVSEDN